MGGIKTNIKMRVTPEQSRKVQEICFANGISWTTGKDLDHLNQPYLYISRYGELWYLSKSTSMYFTYKEVSAEFFIRTNGTCIEPETSTEDNMNKFDFVKLMSTQQPKALSEYLKENGAYESFVENCVNAFLEDAMAYKNFSLNNEEARIGNMFSWADTEQGSDYWKKLDENRPTNLIYDMNEIIFTEVDKRIDEQKAVVNETWIEK